MAHPELQIAVRSPEEGIIILNLEGRITASAEDRLFAAHSTAPSDAKATILNLSGVPSVDSPGVGLLITLLARASMKRQRLLAYGLNEHCLRAFQVTHLDEAVGIYPDEARALASL